jgi:hypothetical protein
MLLDALIAAALLGSPSPAEGVFPAPPAGRAAPWAGGARAALDPKDGPDVDLTVAIEDDEVRWTATVNLAFLDATAPVEREIPELLDGPELEYAHEALAALFAAENRVIVDGVTVPAAETRFDVDPGDPSLLPHFPRFGARALYKLRLTTVHPCSAPPRRVTLVWGIYPPNEALAGLPGGPPPPIEVVVNLSGAGLASTERFTRAEPEVTWHRPPPGFSPLVAVPWLVRAPEQPWPWPLVGGAAIAAVAAAIGPRALRRAAGLGALGLVVLAAVRWTEGPGVALPTSDEALAVFQPLHSNVYRAFDYTQDEDIYDALATSVDGALLARLYDEVYRSLVMQEEGGAVSRVDEVRYTASDVRDIGVVGAEDRVGFVVEARWEVDGSVSHWGHAHRRTNEYRAEYTVTATDAGWRITDSRMLEQRRIDAAPLPDGGAGGSSRAPASDGRPQEPRQGPEQGPRTRPSGEQAR